jgi:hypothetical protein
MSQNQEPANQPQPAAQNADGGQFFIKTLTGKTIVCSLDPDMKILAVKEEIAKAEQIPVDQQRLVYQGKQLEDDHTLGSYAIVNGSSIHLVLRLRGGLHLIHNY